MRQVTWRTLKLSRGQVDTVLSSVTFDPKTKETKDANKISAIKWMSLVVNCSHLQGWGGEGGKAGEVKDIGNALSLVCAPRSWA